MLLTNGFVEFSVVLAAALRDGNSGKDRAFDSSGFRITEESFLEPPIYYYAFLPPLLIRKLVVCLIGVESVVILLSNLSMKLSIRSRSFWQVASEKVRFYGKI